MLMLCPICAGEFQPQEPFCPGCGCGLIPATLEQTVVATRKETVELVELCRPRLYPVAMLIKQTLEQHGVTVLIKGGHSISVMPHLAFGGELRVLVDSDQIEYARALYEAYFESDEETDYIEEA
jgi:hypothetical protein